MLNFSVQTGGGAGRDDADLINERKENPADIEEHRHYHHQQQHHRHEIGKQFNFLKLLGRKTRGVSEISAFSEEKQVS